MGVAAGVAFAAVGCPAGDRAGVGRGVAICSGAVTAGFAIAAAVGPICAGCPGWSSIRRRGRGAGATTNGAEPGAGTTTASAPGGGTTITPRRASRRAGTARASSVAAKPAATTTSTIILRPELLATGTLLVSQSEQRSVGTATPDGSASYESRNATANTGHQSGGHSSPDESASVARSTRNLRYLYGGPAQPQVASSSISCARLTPQRVMAADQTVLRGRLADGSDRR